MTGAPVSVATLHLTDLSTVRFETLWDDGQYVLSRAVAAPSTTALLAVTAASAAPAADAAAQLEHAYALRDELDSAWAARPAALVRRDGGLMLLLADPGGDVLAGRVGQPWEIVPFLRVAIGLATALERLHARGLIHKDLRPANVLVDVATGHAWLTGFRIASRLPREHQASEPAKALAATLPYMAPEQTGRMNRSIDRRTDLYALGVTFYEMLTGALPFTATDALEWVHCHIARQPTPPLACVPGLPPALSDLVMKLLAKTAEERYQTARGVDVDLRRCLASLESEGRIETFDLGVQDLSRDLVVPETLYGREADLAQLLQAFERVAADGETRLVLVSGTSGIGKTSVVNELHRALTLGCGLFASGKFDEDKRDIPHATLAMALQGLVRMILGERESELARWRDAIRQALDVNGHIIASLVPELQLVLGEQAPIPEVAPHEAQHRFKSTVARFLAVFARPEHPLVLFLDDLQWLDAATLELVEYLVSDSGISHLLVVGAYRDDDVGSSHGLARTLEILRTRGARLHEIALAPLARDEMIRLVADAVRCDRTHAEPLATVLHQKTDGNPLFAVQLLAALVDDGSLAFDPTAAAWRWDLARIREKGPTGSLAKLMVRKVSRLPAHTKAALGDLAFLGSSAESALLSLVLEVPEKAVHAALLDAARTGLIVRRHNTYAFLHDRFRQAAYALVPDAERAANHLRIARLLAAHTDVERREETIFEVVNQFNHGAGLASSDAEREHIAELNLLAGRRAKGSTAYEAALNYFRAGDATLPDESRERRPELAFALSFHRAECEFLLGDLAAAEARLSALAARVDGLADRAAVACSRIAVYTTLDRYDRAVDVGREYLAHAGIAWPPHPTDDDVRREYERMWATIADRPIEALADLPRMTAAERRATMDVLVLLVEVALFTDANLFALALGTMVNWSLEYGNSDASCLAYAQLIMVLGPRFGDYPSGFRFGQLGLDLVEHGGLDRHAARVYLVFGHHVMPWMRPLQSGRALLHRALQTAQATGDVTYAAYSGTLLVTNLLASGAPLADVQAEAETQRELARKARFGGVLNALDIQLDLIRALRGQAARGALGDAHQERRFDAGARSPRELTVWWSWIRLLQARFHEGDYAGAVEAAAMAETAPWTDSTFLEVAEYELYSALARAAHYDLASAAERPRHLAALAAHRTRLASWAEHCPANFADRAALVGAEIARLEGRTLDADRLFDEAILLARQHGFVHMEGIANEVAARFQAARGLVTAARAHAASARSCYLRWGADAAVRTVEQRHPQLREQSPPPHPAGAIEGPIERLDLTAALRASQAVSGKIVLDDLIETLMRLALQQAGAERGLLMLARGDEVRIAAEATTAASAVTVHRRNGDPTPAELPGSIVRYVARTRQSVILDDATAENPFMSDPYLRERQARSILCLPLTKQAALVGVLYLENNLAPRVFTPARIQSLTLLASQAAISLENARLFSELQRAEQTVRQDERELRLLFEFVPHHITVLDTDGRRLLDANRAALEYLGFSTIEELTAGGNVAEAMYHPEDVGKVRDTAGGFSGGVAHELEARLRRRDGQYRWYLVRRVPLRDDQGRIVRWYVSGTDIDDRKNAEDKVRQDERELRMVVDFVPQHLVEVDLRGRTLYANRAALEFTGLTLEQTVTHPDVWSEIIHPDHLDTVRAVLGGLADGVAGEVEFRLRRHDGQYRWILGRTAPVRDAQGRVVRGYASGMDIDDRKRAEERAREENVALREEVDKASMFEELVGTSRRLQTVLANIARVAPTDSTVLITGETGTGKELVARAIHKRSGRSSRAFVSVNCAAIPPTLIASELFGHEKGAFTGALTRRLGRFELADGGTIFLDEIGDLPPDTQLALLRVLQEREFERVGSTRAIRVDVRVIAATNRNLPAAMSSGAFRSDLFYRLNVFPIEVPPLRERISDIPLLVAYFVERFADKAGKTIRTVDKRTLELMQSYRWPGNVRELQNVIERAVIVCETDTLVVDENWLSQETRARQPPVLPLGDALVGREREMIEAALAETRGKVAGRYGAAARLGLPPSTLESKIRALKIRKDHYKRP